MSNGQILKDARATVWGQTAWCFGCSVMDNGETRNTKTLQRETRDKDLGDNVRSLNCIPSTKENDRGVLREGGV